LPCRRPDKPRRLPLARTKQLAAHQVASTTGGTAVGTVTCTKGTLPPKHLLSICDTSHGRKLSLTDGKAAGQLPTNHQASATEGGCHGSRIRARVQGAAVRWRDRSTNRAPGVPPALNQAAELVAGACWQRVGELDDQLGEHYLASVLGEGLWAALLATAGTPPLVDMDLIWTTP
jgi:hypothetical protein